MIEWEHTGRDAPLYWRRPHLDRKRQTGRKTGTQSQEAKAEGTAAMPVRLPHTYVCLREQGRRMSKKALALLMVFCMVVSALSISALAIEGTPRS